MLVCMSLFSFCFVGNRDLKCEKTLMRQFLDKYIRVDGEVPEIPDPVSLRATHLTTLADNGMCAFCLLYSYGVSFVSGLKKLKEIASSGQYFVALECDETDDPRPSNDYIVTVDVYLFPKVSKPEDSSDVMKFHVKVSFPTAVNNETISTCIHEVFPMCNVCFRHCTIFFSMPCCRVLLGW